MREKELLAEKRKVQVTAPAHLVGRTIAGWRWNGFRLCLRFTDGSHAFLRMRLARHLRNERVSDDCLSLVEDWDPKGLTRSDLWEGGVLTTQEYQECDQDERRARFQEMITGNQYEIARLEQEIKEWKEKMP